MFILHDMQIIYSTQTLVLNIHTLALDATRVCLDSYEIGAKTLTKIEDDFPPQFIPLISDSFLLVLLLFSIHNCFCKLFLIDLGPFV